ncbi:MAG TPA: CehA/McbA family metallohydrolase [Bryobacteraceae bacterium]|nr:CehA/McbA family metallohydrolase [Bryobacteraceae bacterium]
MRLLATLLVVLAPAYGQTTNPEPEGWWAGDAHVHCDCGVAGGASFTPAQLREAMQINNLSVISMLADMGNGEVRDATADLPRVDGEDDPLSTPERVLHWDAEWHFDPRGVTFAQKAIGGHLIVLGLGHAERRFAEYTWPILDWALKQHAVVGFAHMQYLPDGIPQDLNCCAPLEYPVEVALGTASFLMEDVDGSDTAIESYYRLLNCGFRPGLAASTDFPCNFRKPIGSLLTYVYVPGGKLTYRAWIEGIGHGRTVVSRHGHREFLEVRVNHSALPGDEIRLPRPGAVPVDVQWRATEKLSGRLELVRNGKVVASRQVSAAPGSPADLRHKLEFRHSGWLCARVMDAQGHRVHSGAVFVTVAGEPTRASAADAEFFMRWIDNLIARTTPPADWSVYLAHDRDGAHARYQEAKRTYKTIAAEARQQERAR